jgi:Ca2+/Na+ antiporter
VTATTIATNNNADTPIMATLLPLCASSPDIVYEETHIQQNEEEKIGL